jgi:hypothetical protein
MLWMFWLFLAGAGAQQVEVVPPPPIAEVFPLATVPLPDSVALLTADQMGTPAERWDQRTVTPGAATELEREIEAAMLGDEAALSRARGGANR